MGMMINLVSIQDEKMGMVIDFGGCEGYKEMRASIQKISQVRYDSVESGTTRSSPVRLGRVVSASKLTATSPIPDT